MSLARLPLNPLDIVRDAIGSNIQAAFSADRMPQEQYTDPPGDPGLFGPDSVTWRVHAHASGIVGGFSSLMMQALHPLAMAGVAEHSDFRRRPLVRLSRTASFVAGTTYGSTEVAEALIAVVNRIHIHVKGIAPDGRPYSALDPDLIRWVHVAEMGSIMRANQRYNPRPLRGGECDRYFDETAIVAEKLGGTNIPRSRAEVQAYMRAIRPELVAGDQAMETMAFLMTPIGADPVSKAVSQTLIQGALDLLPAWAREMYGIRRPPGFDAFAVRPAVWGLINTLAVVLGEPPAVAEARARAAIVPPRKSA